MTQPDAVVTRAHRELAAREFFNRRGFNEHWLEALQPWFKTGDDEWLEKANVKFHKRRALASAVRALANLEAAVRREYEGVVGDLKHAAEVGQEDRSLALFLLDKAIEKLETLKNA